MITGARVGRPRKHQPEPTLGQVLGQLDGMLDILEDLWFLSRQVERIGLRVLDGAATPEECEGLRKRLTKLPQTVRTKYFATLALDTHDVDEQTGQMALPTLEVRSDDAWMGLPGWSRRSERVHGARDLQTGP